MVSSFVLQNLTTMEKATFGQEPKYEFLYKEDGLDWGQAQANHNTYTYPGQIGVYISSTVVRGRDISITGYACYMLSAEEMKNIPFSERVAYGYKKILRKKEKLNGIVNPFHFVRLTIGSYYIEGKPSSSIKYGQTESENNQFFCKFTINLFCNDPMFRKASAIQTVLNGVSPAFHFPLVFPKDKGIIFSEQRAYSLIAIENEGQVDIGALITLKARGNVSNPVIENIGTGERIVINKTLETNEVIEIDTTDGNSKSIKGYKDGEWFNYFKYWNFENDWLKFPLGISLIGYSVDDELESLLDVSVSLIPKKYTLEEM